VIYEVWVSAELATRIRAAHGPERSASGRPSEWDFWSGPLAAALVAFRDFETLTPEAGPAVRALHLVDPVFGALVFIAVLVEPGVVEIADYADDPGYWDLIQGDPDS
jgi:hypothetical protein